MLSLVCDSEHCNFRTPLQGREQYQAMVAHLQVHSALAHGAALPPTPGEAPNSNVIGRGCPFNTAGYVGGFEDDDASALRSRSRSRRRDRTFRCTDCNDRAYETEKGLKVHKQRYCGKPREEGAFPCTACDKVFVTAGLLKMHMGRFHTDRSASRVRGNDHGHRNNVDNRSEEDASISTSNERGVTPGRDSTVGEGHRELFGNNEELRGRKDSVARSTSSFGICGARGDEMSAVQKSGGLVMSTSQGLQTCGGAGTSSYGRGRSESPATSVWSDRSSVSSTMEGRKSLVKVDMVVENCVTRITYRVTSTAPIGIILPKVSLKLGTDPENIQLRMVNMKNDAEKEVPRSLPREEGQLVDMTDSAEHFNNKVIYAVVVK